MTAIEGSINGFHFKATLQPDGQKSHWLKIDRKLREAAAAEVGDIVTLEITPASEEPEPEVPTDLREALAAATPKARKLWFDVTPIARRDWIQMDHIHQAGRDARALNQKCLLNACGRKASPLLLRPLRLLQQKLSAPKALG